MKENSSLRHRDASLGPLPRFPMRRPSRSSAVRVGSGLMAKKTATHSTGLWSKALKRNKNTRLEGSFRPTHPEGTQRLIHELQVHQVEIEMQNEELRASSLRRSHDDLEVRVQERTARLLNANEELSREINERNRAEDALLKSNEALASHVRFQRELLDTATIWIDTLDSEGNITFWNRAAEEISGYSRAEVVGNAEIWKWLYPDPEYRADITRKASEIIHEGKRVESLETSIRCRDGSIRVISWYSNWLRDESGQTVGSVALGADVTARKQAEDALRKSERRFRTVADVLSVGLFEADDGGNWVFVNDRWCAISGGTFDEAMGQGWEQFVHPEDRARTAGAWRHAVQQKAAFSANGRIQTPDGQIKHVVIWGAPITAGGEQVIGYVGSVTDITERKTAEEALRESEERYRVLVENGPDGVVLAAAGDGRLVMVNSRAAQLHGYDSPEEMVASGKAALDFVSSEDHSRVRSEVRKLVDNGRVTSLECTLLRKDGTPMAAEISAALVHGPNGQCAGCILIERDTSARERTRQDNRRLELQIQQAQKMESLGILAGGIAHDFNNLLTVVIGNASLAIMKSPHSSPLQGYLTGIETAAKRAAALSSQMLAYSGKGRFVVEPTSLNQVVTEMGCLLEASISKKVALRYDLAKDLPAILADVTQLRQVIMNLLTNASEAIGEQQGEICVTSGARECDQAYLRNAFMHPELAAGTYVHLDVTDTGCGMDQSTLARIFDPFFSTKFTGRGLGLCALLGIVRGHKGAILVRSTPSRGTSFRLLFPAAAAPKNVEVAAVEPGEWRGEGTILLVDDEPGVLEVASTLLKQIGFSVLTAENGRRGVALFRDHLAEISCVLLDLKMPEMDGWEALAELKRIKRDVRVILSSGYSEQESVSGVLANELAGFLHKPYDYAEIVNTLRSVLQEGSASSPSST